MIELHYHNGNVFIFNIEDWKILRTQYRIVGDVVGSSQFLPSLPVILLPEEIALLLKKNVAQLVKYEYLCKEPSKNDEDIYTKLTLNLLDEERKLVKESRRKQLEHMKDIIVSAKRKKGDERCADEILEEEFNKSTSVDENNMIWPIFIQHLKETRGNPTDVDKNEIMQKTTKTKCAVYENLWQKGYYITLGHKFGGDFLAYLGDPILYHAIYIIRCVDNVNKMMHATEIVAFGRLGSSVKKRAVLAALNLENEIEYVTLNWIDT